jgi:hypothetical protein
MNSRLLPNVCFFIYFNKNKTRKKWKHNTLGLYLHILLDIADSEELITQDYDKVTHKIQKMHSINF